MANRREMGLERTGYLHRARLDTLLAHGLNHSLTTVIAGPGFGKTMAVTSFLNQLKKRVIWLRLIKLDNDTSRFWRSFCTAVREEMPELADQLANIPFPESVGLADAFLRAFSGHLYDGEQVVLVVDDFECITSEKIKDFFALLMEASLENFSLILISGIRLHLGYTKTDSGQLRITMNDLRFTESEIEQLFQLNGLELDTDTIHAISEKTGGWPLAVYLLSSGYKNYEEKGSFAEQRLSQLTSELFEQSYYKDYPPEIQRLLVKLSYFRSFSVDIIKELCDCDLQDIINQLSSNIFIYYDHYLRQFIFQNMYRDYLSHKQGMLPEDEVIRINSIAGDWFMKNGHAHEAIECFWACRDYEKIIITVMGMPAQRNSNELSNFILYYLNRFPKEFSDENYLVDFCRVFLYLNNLETIRAQDICGKLIARMEPRRDDPEVRILLGEMYAVLADISVLRNNDNGLEYIKKSVEYLQGGSSVRTSELLPVGNDEVFYLPDNKPRQVDRMIDYFSVYMSYSEYISNGCAYGFDKLFAAEGSYYIGKVDQAIYYCYQTIYQAQLKNQYDIIGNAYFLLMRIGLYCGDLEQALSALKKLKELLEICKLPLLTDIYNSAECWLHVQLGDIEHANFNFTRSLYEKMPLGVGRNALVYTYLLLSRQNYYEAHAALSQMSDVFRQKGLWHARLLSHIMKARCIQVSGDTERTAEEFWKAYNMAHQNGIATVFAESGAATCKLIDSVRNQEKYHFDSSWLDHIRQLSQAYANRCATMSKLHNRGSRVSSSKGVNLTGRELEVLNYLAQGMTRNEIGDILNISVNGVKKHIATIYTKLGAINRADAMHIATVRELIK